MKKLFFTIIMLAVCRQFSFAQWTTSGNNIYNSNSGNVGIGLTNPTSPLHIYSTGSNLLLNLQNTSATGYTQLGYTGTGRTYQTGVGNASESYWGVGNSYYIYDGGSNAMRFVINSAGNVGIGTTTPGGIIDAQGMAIFGWNNGNGRVSITDAIGLNRNAYNGAIYNTSGYGYQLGHVLSTNPAADIIGFSIWSPGGGYVANNVFTISAQAHVGVNSDAPFSMLQVDDGVSKTSIGSAGDVGSSTLGNGTGYLGFNAARYYSGSGSTQSWAVNTDGYNNGGGVIYSTVTGSMRFAPIASTGNSTVTLGDADIAGKVMMELTPTALYAKQIYVQTSAFPDYVFKKDYRLRSLADVKIYIDKNHHLPEIPAAKEVIKEGINLGEMNKLLTKKVEELTLYLIEKDSADKAQQAEISEQKRKVLNQQHHIEQLETKLNRLLNQRK